MPSLYMEWGEDLVLTPGGSLQMASGWDEVRQRIERRLLTNPLEVLPDGEPVTPDYIFDTTYGLGIPKYVGQNPTQDQLNQLRQKTNQGVMIDDQVSNAYPPGISLYKGSNPFELLMIIRVVLKSGQPGQIALSLP